MQTAPFIHTIDDSEIPLDFFDERIEAAIVKTDAKIAFFDPIQGYMGDASINSASKVRPMMKHLAGVADRTGCAIVLIGHLNKSGNKSQYRGLGSIDIRAAARSILVVGKTNDGTRAIVHDKSNLAPHGSSIAFSLDRESGFNWIGECDVTIDELLESKPAKGESQSDKAKRIILSMLSDDKEVAATEIINAGKNEGISSATMERVRKDLGVASKKEGKNWVCFFPTDDLTVGITEEPTVSEEPKKSEESQAQQTTQNAGISIEINP